MNKNFIFGSGLIGCIAKAMYPDYAIVPFKRSRYFSFPYVYSNNYLTYDERTTTVFKDLGVDDRMPVLYKIAYSYHGALFNNNDDAKQVYLNKIYGDHVPKVAMNLNTDTFTVYQTSAQELHTKLQDKFYGEIQENAKQFGEVKHIDVTNKIFYNKENVAFEYDNIISTIPRDALLNYCNVAHNLMSKQIVYYTIRTKKIDMENNQQLLICDENIDFFKCQKLFMDVYQFWSFNIIDFPAKYISKLIGNNFEILDSRYIEGAFPYGDVIDTPDSIDCVGSNACWDDLMNVTSAIIKLKKI